MNIKSVHNLFNNIIILIFIIIICTPPLATIFISKSNISKSENRNLSAMPDVEMDSKGLKDFQSKFETFYNDNFGFRNVLLGCLSTIKVNCFNKSPVSIVLIGKDDWLFYNRDYVINGYRGLTPYNQHQLDTWKNTIENRQKWLADQGIRYLFFAVPDKPTIYPEYLPDSIFKVNKNHLDQLHEYFADHSSIKLIDLRIPLREAKSDELIYYKTDTHWTDKGAFIAYTNIMKQLMLWFPELSILDQSSVRIDQVGKQRDLALALGLLHPWNERNFYISLNSPCARELAIRTPVNVPREGVGSIFAKGCSSRKLRAVVFRDSFFSSIEPFLSEHFEKIVYIWAEYDYTILKDIIDKIHPDIVIEERAERELWHFPSPENPYLIGKKLAKEVKMDSAIEYFQEALRIDPTFIPALNSMGIILSQKGDIQNAIEQFQKVSNLTNDYNLMKNYNIAQMAQEKKNQNLDRQITFLQEQIKTNPNDSLLHAKLGDMYLNRGYLGRAENEYKLSISIKPDFTYAINKLAHVYSQQGDYNNALIQLNKAVKIIPNNKDVYYNIACVYAKQNDTNNSIKWLRKSVQTGFDKWDLIQKDEDLINIRFAAEYKQLIRNHY